MDVCQMKKSNCIAKFPNPENLGERLWGEEILLAASAGNFTLKKLFIKAGSKGGLQYHRMKEEAGYVLSGQLLIRYDDGTGGLSEKIVGPGECFLFPKFSVHQEEAIEDTVIIEASTPFLNDRVRVEKKYGIEEIEGLPTTSESEIIKI
jgi:mannose-6-phosphate isomerase